MDLSQKQEIFAKNVGIFINYVCAIPGYALTLGEAYRTPEQAQIDAQKGTGIVDSLHCKRLALDFNLFHNGLYLAQTDDYKQFGEYWKSLHPLNRWGGDFKRGDGNHIEMQDI